MIITKKQPKETARDYALRTLKYNIITLELAPGIVVSENELSSQLGLSRTPVREALIELSKVGIVEVLPQKGSRVSLIDYNFIEEFNFLRRVLETAVVELACEVAIPEDIFVLEQNLNQQEFYLKNPSPAGLLEADDQFHRELFRMCSKMQVYNLMSSMSTHFDRVRELSLTTVKDIKIVQDHRAILEAIKTKDKEVAKATIEKHLSRYKLDEEVIRSNYPHFFK
ncbi:MAG TPA: GntR family transcriptional regulator [Anaerovoracaceae bacterium]|nr:GntR family transcriptional regulator [Anaerovoracaceae bacterium]